VFSTATPVNDVVAYISRDAEFDMSHPEIPYSYLFRALQLSLWRPIVPESDRNTDDLYFATIGIGNEGYFDRV
jgi:hypothetical protein